MRQQVRTGLAALVLASCVGGDARAARPAVVADETITVNLFAGDDGPAIAARFGAAWTLVGAFDCSVSGNKLLALNTNGDCDEMVSQYAFEPAGGVLTENHQMSLRIQCTATMASMDLDAQGFTALSLGSNVFASGSDTITVNFSFPPAPTSGLPSMPAWIVVLLSASLLAGGALLSRSARQRPA